MDTLKKEMRTMKKKRKKKRRRKNLSRKT